MRVLAILLVLLGIARSESESAPIPPNPAPPPANHPILVYDLTSNEEWDATLAWAQNNTDLPKNMLASGIEKTILATFYAPWCQHCRKMIPNMLEASEKLDRWGFSKLVRIARIDCTKAKKRCAVQGVYSYPTIGLLNKKGEMVSEFPDGPRTTDAILTFMAGELRPKEVLPFEDEATWTDALGAVHKCHDTRNPIARKDMAEYTCRSLALHNLIVGGAAGVVKLLEIRPELLETHLIYKVDDEKLKPPVMATMDHVCWVDNVLTRRTHCVDTAEENAEKELLTASHKWANPMGFESASWEIFFQARRQAPKMTALLAGSRGFVSNYFDWQKRYIKIAEKKLGSDMIFLETNNAAPLAKVFEQVGAADGALPWIGVFSGPLSKQTFFKFDGTMDELEDWVIGVKNGEVEPFYIQQKESWLQSTKREFVVFGQIVKRAWKNSPIHQKLLMGGMVITIIAGIVAINRLIPSEEECAKRIIEEATNDKNGNKTATDTSPINDRQEQKATTVRQRK